MPTSELVKHDRTMPGEPSPRISFSTLREHQGEGAPEWLDRLYIYMAISIRIMNGDFYSIVSSLGLYNLCGLSYAQLYAPRCLGAVVPDQLLNNGQTDFIGRVFLVH